MTRSDAIRVPNTDAISGLIQSPVPRASLWLHNGSQVELKTTDAGGREFYYYKPSDHMAKLVSAGTLLFEGRKNSNTYSGTMRRFHQTCGVITYAVEGEVQGDVRVVLRGTYPRRDPSTCQTVEHVSEELVFEYIQRIEESGRIVARDR